MEKGESFPESITPEVYQRIFSNALDPLPEGTETRLTSDEIAQILAVKLFGTIDEDMLYNREKLREILLGKIEDVEEK